MCSRSNTKERQNRTHAKEVAWKRENTCAPDEFDQSGARYVWEYTDLPALPSSKMIQLCALAILLFGRETFGRKWNKEMKWRNFCNFWNPKKAEIPILKFLCRFLCHNMICHHCFPRAFIPQTVVPKTRILTWNVFEFSEKWSRKSFLAINYYVLNW